MSRPCIATGFYAGAADKFTAMSFLIRVRTRCSLFASRTVSLTDPAMNYPIQVFGRSCMPALAAGNTCVVKPSETRAYQFCAAAELAAEAGFPPGVLNVVTGYGKEAGAALSAHPDVDHISFTGSPESVRPSARQRVSTPSCRPGARGKVPADSLCRRRSRRRVATDHKRDHTKQRTDLRRWQSRVTRAQHIRAGHERLAAQVRGLVAAPARP